MIWFNGKIVDEGERLFQSTDRGVLLGDGLFETVKVVNRHPLFLAEHLCRMQQAADELSLPLDRAALREGLMTLLVRCPDDFSGVARLTVTRGSGGRGLVPIAPDHQSPELLISLARMSFPSAVSDPDQLVFCSFARGATAPSSRLKTLSYTDNLAARAEALSAGAEDSLLMNERGEVACTSMANIFVQIDDEFITPPLSSGVLPGTIRAQILRYAQNQGVQVGVRHIRQSEVLGRWVYRTNSLLGVRRGWVKHSIGAKPPQDAPSEVLNLLLEAAEREDMPA